MIKKRYSMEEILKAKEILDLPTYFTADFLKKTYLKLVKKFHPDKNMVKNEEYDEKIKKINWAYNVINDFITNYEYSLSKDAIARYNPDAGSSFTEYIDPHWGKK